MAIMRKRHRLAAGHAVTARPIKSGGQLMGAWSSLVWDRLRGTDAVMSFVDTAIRVPEKDCPGSEFRLPSLPAVRRPPACSAGAPAQATL